MISLVTPENRNMYEAELDQMWRQRHRVFIEKLKWDLESIDGKEIDQFDTPNSMYLLNIGDDGNVQGSMRLLETVRPHMISEVFAFLCRNGPPRSADVWEASRTHMLAKDRTKVYMEIMCGMMETCLLFGIERVTSMSDLKILPSVLNLGINVEPLGVPQDYQGEQTMAYSMAITPTALANIRTVAGISAPVLNYQRMPIAA